MALVSGTRLHLRSWRFFVPFVVYAQRAARQARRSEGNLGVELHRDSRAGYWTCTVWRDEASMRAFMMTGAHADAMRHFQRWADEAYVVQWTQGSTEMPSWREVSQRMKTVGRRTNLRFPSHAHEHFEVPDLS
jgi:quinol monooxygenase YgiN